MKKKLVVMFVVVVIIVMVAIFFGSKMGHIEEGFKTFQLSAKQDFMEIEISIKMDFLRLFWWSLKVVLKETLKYLLSNIIKWIFL